MSKTKSDLEELKVGQTDLLSEQPRRAFIVSPPSVDTGVIREELEQRGISPYALEEVSINGRSLTGLLDECMRRADLVVVVLGGGPRDDVLVGLGYAMALNKRILVLVSPEEELPVGSVPYLRTRPDNREAFAFGLTQVLAMPTGWRPVQGLPAQRTRPLGSVADDLLEKYRKAACHPDEQERMGIVRAALDASGIAAINPSSERTSNGGVDFAVWADDFEPWVGNPLLIGVRGCLETAAERDRVLAAMTDLLERTHSAWGLLLHSGKEGESEANGLHHPRVFHLTIERFLESLRETSLGDLLSRMRNQRVHGRG